MHQKLNDDYLVRLPDRNSDWQVEQNYRKMQNGKGENMNITIEALEKVMEETGLDYKEAKALLLTADGDPEKAIHMVKQEVPDGEIRIDEIIGKIKEKVNEGETDRIQISKKGEVLLNIPVNAGIVGSLVGFVAAPWAFITAAAVSFGLGCKFEIVKKDGSREDVANR